MTSNMSCTANKSRIVGDFAKVGVFCKGCPLNAKVGSFCKGGVKTQRTCRFQEVGSKRKESFSGKSIMEFYSLDNLKRIARDRGYPNVRNLASALQPYFGIDRKRVITKLEEGWLTKEQCEVIGAFLEMTPKEYYETFMQGYFKQTRRGAFVAEIDGDYAYHIRYSNRDQRWVKQQEYRDKQRQKAVEEAEAFMKGDAE